MRIAVLFLANHRRQLRFLQILLLLCAVILLTIDEALGLPGWLPLLFLGMWGLVASYDMIAFPGLRGILRQTAGIVILVLGVFAIVLSFRLMGG